MFRTKSNAINLDMSIQHLNQYESIILRFVSKQIVPPPKKNYMCREQQTLDCRKLNYQPHVTEVVRDKCAN